MRRTGLVNVPTKILRDLRDYQDSRVRSRVDRHAATNLSSKLMANWVFTSRHSHAGIFHSPAIWRKTRYSGALQVMLCPGWDSRISLIARRRRSMR